MDFPSPGGVQLAQSPRFFAFNGFPGTPILPPISSFEMFSPLSPSPQPLTPGAARRRYSPPPPSPPIKPDPMESVEISDGLFSMMQRAGTARTLSSVYPHPQMSMSPNFPAMEIYGHAGTPQEVQEVPQEPQERPTASATSILAQNFKQNRDLRPVKPEQPNDEEFEDSSEGAPIHLGGGIRIFLFECESINPGNSSECILIVIYKQMMTILTMERGPRHDSAVLISQALPSRSERPTRLLRSAVERR
jgi:hypothetical protein